MAKKKKEDTGEDYSFYTTIMLPNGRMQHEADEWCWCNPEIKEDEDGNVVDVLHQCPQ